MNPATMLTISAEQSKDRREQAAAWKRAREAGGASRPPRAYQWPRWTTSSNGRRSGFLTGVSGRSAG